MQKTKLFTLLLVLGLALQFSFSESTEAAEDDVVVFEDEILAEAVYSKIGKSENITESDLLNVDTLEISSDVKITNLSGLEHAKNLKTIYFAKSEIADFTPISKLDQLESININNNGISDSNLVKSLENLTNLTSLALGGNNITDLSTLSNLTKLESLDLSNNKIADLSGLEGLTNLKSLYLTNNEIIDLSSLDGLTNLTWLGLEGNSISDLSPTANLSKLVFLFLSNNNITTINVLSELSNLEAVALDKNPLNLSKGSSTYQNVQKLLMSDVNVVLDREDVFTLKTKKVTNDSITVEWSIFENTKQVRDEFTLYLNGKQETVIEGSDITEYTFKDLEDGKEYEIRIDFSYSTIFAGGLETEKIHVKAEDKKTAEQIIIKPTVKGNNVTIAYENINAVKSNGQLVLDLKDYTDDKVDVQLTNEQIKMLQEENISIEINKGDASVEIPASILGEGKDVNLVMERLEKAEGALASTYDFTITTDAGNISNFSVPVTLSFQVDESAVANTENVKVWYYNPTTKEWENNGGTYSNGTVTAETNHFSTYTVFEKEEPSDIIETGSSNNDAGAETETNSGNELPDTATNTMNFLLLGFLFILLALALLFYRNGKARV